MSPECTQVWRGLHGSPRHHRRGCGVNPPTLGGPRPPAGRSGEWRLEPNEARIRDVSWRGRWCHGARRWRAIAAWLCWSALVAPSAALAASTDEPATPEPPAAEPPAPDLQVAPPGQADRGRAEPGAAAPG